MYCFFFIGHSILREIKHPTLSNPWRENWFSCWSLWWRWSSEQKLEQGVPCAKGSKQRHWEHPPPVISTIPHLPLFFSLYLSHIVVLIGILLIPFHVVPVNKWLYPLLQISRLQKDEAKFSGICSMLRVLSWANF